MIAQAAALLLVAAAIVVWFVAPGARPAARVQIRFAGVLFAAAGVAALTAPATAPSVLLLVLPIALAVLALAGAAGFGRPLPPALAAIILAVICLAGLGAAITGLVVFALAPAALAAVALGVVFARRFDSARTASMQGLLAALCFLAAASSFALEGAGAPLLLFSSAGLLGATLALSRSGRAVDEKGGRDLRGAVAIRGRRDA
jgi:hypothetical protein